MKSTNIARSPPLHNPIPWVIVQTYAEDAAMFNSQGAAHLPGLHRSGWRVSHERGEGSHSKGEREVGRQTSKGCTNYGEAGSEEIDGFIQTG
jgi:hypothetical protein